MRYALLVSYDQNTVISPAERARRAAGLASVPVRRAADGAFGDRLRLQPASTAVTVRCWDGGDVLVSPGPVTAAREQLAACFVVDCPGIDEAIEIATGIPAAWYGSVEVRPVVAEAAQAELAGLAGPAPLASATGPALALAGRG